MKKRNIPKISAVILGVLICVFIGVLINKLKENYDPEVFSEDYISIDEVKQELAFTATCGNMQLYSLIVTQSQETGVSDTVSAG